MQHQNSAFDFTEHYTAARDTINNTVSDPAKAAGRIAQKQLHDYLQKMFDNVDDVLFDYADKAENNQQQRMYFDAMREIRVQKNNVEKSFGLNCEKLSNKILNGAHIKDCTDKGADTEHSFTALSLVEENDLEESLAITNMVAKAHNLYREELIAIAHRYDHIVDIQTITSDNNPVSPDLVCMAFEQASESFSEELEIRLVVYKLFDKFVVSNLGTMYKEINAMFIAAGVLPTIKLKAPLLSNGLAARTTGSDEKLLPELQSAQLSGDPPSALASGHQGVSSVNGNLFESLQQLLALQRAETYGGQANNAMLMASPVATEGHVHGGHANTSTEFGVNTTPSEPGYYFTNDILAGLSQLQANSSITGYSNSDTPSSESIKSTLLKTIGVHHGNESEKNLEHSESDVIDIVSMMFDFILDDKTLPDAIRALVARLQIPIIKLAILDKTFFSKKTHAARLLLNELAYAGTTLDNEANSDDDSLQKKISDVVNRILSDFDTDITIFDDLLLEFRAFIETELAADKLAGEMLEETKQRVSDKIEESIQQYKIPIAIHNFLVSKWKDALTEIGLRDHCEGPAWQAALDFVDDLIWSIQPKLLASERHELVRIIPRILKGLQDGLTLIGIDQDEINSYLEELEVLHLACLKGLPENDEQDVPQATKTADSSTEDMPYDSGNEADLGYMKLTPHVINSHIFAFVRDMDIGAWVEFYNQGKVKRGKLSWKCDFTGDYTFVDRRYRIVADIAIADLVKCLENGQAAIVEDVPLLDRAIGAVVNTMQRCVNGTKELLPTN
ncbi:MAG: DUF1631 domain-containing protein [Gammaproteobacteria bacterium]|nr:DUF1631 domain-containing protein [Gammaproteobacteria bacterium]